MQKIGMGGTGRSPEEISFRDQLTLVVISDISKYFSVVNVCILLAHLVVSFSVMGTGIFLGNHNFLTFHCNVLQMF